MTQRVVVAVIADITILNNFFFEISCVKWSKDDVDLFALCLVQTKQLSKLLVWIGSITKNKYECVQTCLDLIDPLKT